MGYNKGREAHTAEAISAARDQRAAEIARRRESLDHDMADALTAAEDAEAVAEMLAGHGAGPWYVTDAESGDWRAVDPADVISPVSGPAENETLPAEAPHHREMVAGWVGRAPRRGEPLAAAWDALGPLGTWLACARLEPPPEQGVPTASVSSHLADCETALRVLTHIAEGRRIDGVGENGKPWAAFPISLIEAARAVYTRKEHLAAVLAGRAKLREHEQGARPGSRGARGAASAPTRCRRFLRAVEPLGWSDPDLARLVIESGTWAHPPCRRYVADLLDDARGDRQEAIRLLARRFVDARRPRRKRRKKS